MCVTQHAHCQIYSNTRLTPLLRKVLPQKTELIVTRYLPDEVLNEGSDKGRFPLQSLCPRRWSDRF